ncbi:MAG: hypothetical protein LBC37_03695 [Zoogloeaceae bacterium]|nr:hypothetical protein [Zoogloeaceae bacterium]
MMPLRREDVAIHVAVADADAQPWMSNWHASERGAQCPWARWIATDLWPSQ